MDETARPDSISCSVVLHTAILLNIVLTMIIVNHASLSIQDNLDW